MRALPGAKMDVGGRPPDDVGASSRQDFDPAASDETAGTDGKLDGASVLSSEVLIQRQATVLRLIAEFIDQRTLTASLTALVGELHQRFYCDRVVVGLFRDGAFTVSAISQQATIDAKSGEVRLLIDAMQEACDQDVMIQFPDTHQQLHIVDAHRSLTGGRDHAEVCTIPVCHQGVLIGALLLERTAKELWPPATIELLRQIADISAPLIALRRDGEKGVLQTLTERARRVIPALLRPQHVAAKTSVVVITLLLVGAYFAPVAHRVSAQAEVVPTERRVITAPMMGFIESVNVDAGDHVLLGQPLLSLDVEDLQLERAKWANEIDSNRVEFRSAMAGHDRKEMAVIQARSNQAQAQLDLIDRQLTRAQMLSPTAGLVVTGDLSQSLGAPVERGQILLEIAPAEGYQVNLFVDEVDVPYVRPGQVGRLSLKASPNEAIEFEVRSIHPIAQARDGMNRFRVKANLLAAPSGMRPGQTGVGKVDVGEARLLWVWTHRFIEWSRRQIWEWIG